MARCRELWGIAAENHGTLLDPSGIRYVGVSMTWHPIFFLGGGNDLRGDIAIVGYEDWSCRLGNRAICG